MKAWVELTACQNLKYLLKLVADRGAPVNPGSQWLSFLFSQFPNIYLCGFLPMLWKRPDLLKSFSQVVEGK